MRWKVFGHRRVYRSKWVGLYLSDVDSGEERYEHHLVRVPPSVGLVVVIDECVLMLWRHRFTTDTWNWEVPGGWVDDGEEAAAAAVREAEEETGWRAHDPEEWGYLQPISGIADAEQRVFLARSATWTGPPAHDFESDEVAWVPLSAVPTMIRRREIVGGVSVAALLLLLHEADGRTVGGPAEGVPEPADRAPRPAA